MDYPVMGKIVIWVIGELSVNGYLIKLKSYWVIWQWVTW